MKVYHGSYTAIENIDFSFCRKKRDFGKGFYVTKIRSQAEYWASRKGEDNDVEGVVTKFEFDESFFEDDDLKVLRFDGYSKEWLDFVVQNRVNKKDLQAHDYDIVEGPVADDDIATRVYDYMKNKVSKEQFLSELARKKTTHQICFCTMQSLQALELQKSKIDSKIFHTDNKVLQALMVDFDLSETEVTDKYYKSNTYTKFANENTDLHKKTWQEIYEILKLELNMRKHFIILFFLFPILVFSQTVVTLEQCQKWAICQSSANVQKELNTQLLKVKLDDAASHLFPTLEINGHISYQSHTPQLPLSLGVEQLSRDHYGIFLDLKQVIYAGSKLLYGREYERMMNKSEIDKLDLSIHELKEKIIAIYLNLLILDKQVSLLSSVANTIEEQLVQLKKLFESGVVYGNTLAQLELEALKIEQQKGELVSTKEALIASLSIITGQELHNAIFVVPDAPVINKNSTSSRLEFSIFDYSKKGLDYQRKFFLSNSLPSFTFFASGGYGRPTFNIFSNKFDWSYLVGIKFNIPIIAWVKTMGVGNIINLQKKILESHERDFEKWNQIAIEEKWNEIQKIENLIVLDEQITEKYKLITETLKVQLLYGTITAYDFIKQQNDELQSLINREVHLMQLLKAKFEFLALKGAL